MHERKVRAASASVRIMHCCQLCCAEHGAERLATGMPSMPKTWLACMYGSEQACLLLGIALLPEGLLPEFHLVHAKNLLELAVL